MSFIPVGIDKSLPGATLTSSIPYIGDNHLLKQDRNNLNYSDTTHRLGVGIAAPLYTIHAAGGIKSDATGFIFPDGSIQTSASVGGSDPLTITKGITANALTSSYLRVRGTDVIADIGTNSTNSTTFNLTTSGTNGVNVNLFGSNSNISFWASDAFTGLSGQMYGSNTDDYPIAGSKSGDFVIIAGSAIPSQTNKVILASGSDIGLMVQKDGVAVTPVGLSTAYVRFSDGTTMTTASVGGSDPLTITKGITTNALTSTYTKTGSGTAPAVPAALIVSDASTPQIIINAPGASGVPRLDFYANGSALGDIAMSQGVNPLQHFVLETVPGTNRFIALSPIQTSSPYPVIATPQGLTVTRLQADRGATVNALTVSNQVIAATATISGSVSAQGLTGATTVFSQSVQMFGSGALTFPDGTTQTSAFRDATYSFTIDGGSGSLIATGQKYAFVNVKSNFTVTGWELATIGLAGATTTPGFLLADIYKNTAPNNFPPNTSVCGSQLPVAVSGMYNASTDLTGWNTSWAKDAWLDVNILGATNVSKAVLVVRGKERSFL